MRMLCCPFQHKCGFSPAAELPVLPREGIASQGA